MYIFTVEGRNMVDFTDFLINGKKVSRTEIFQHINKNRKFDIISIILFIQMTKQSTFIEIRIL